MDDGIAFLVVYALGVCTPYIFTNVVLPRIRKKHAGGRPPKNPKPKEEEEE